MKKRVEYKGEGFDKKFNIQHNLNKFWGVDVDELIGLELVDRLNPKHTAKIIAYDFRYDTATVAWENGGWNCLDHAIEQFDVLKEELTLIYSNGEIKPAADGK